jgi:hypothetical protein
MYTDDSGATAAHPTDPDVPPDHEVAEHPHLPPLSVWPIALAAGITVAAAGLVTDWEIGAIGLIVMFISIVQWVQELRHERVESH